MATAKSSLLSRSATIRATPSPKTAYPAALRRKSGCCVRGVKLPAEFTAFVEQALERQGSEVGGQVGIPGLKIAQGFKQTSGPGTLLWEAGVHLAAFLVETHGQAMLNKEVLELGCGTGIVGITTAVLGAHAVMTDIPDVLGEAQTNIDLNSNLLTESQGSVDLAILDWNNPQNELLDMNYDYVVGSDLIYSEGAIRPLAGVVARLAGKGNRPRVYMCHCHRSAQLDTAMAQGFADVGLRLQPQDWTPRNTQQSFTVYEVL